jgi:hypothetical protein
MRKHSVLTVIAASLLLALGQNAVACSLGGRQLTVQLEEGGAELGARNAREILQNPERSLLEARKSWHPPRP